MEKIVKLHATERIDLADGGAIGGGLSLLENARLIRQIILPTGRNTGQANTEARIFSGFAIQNIVGGTCDITRGKGIFKLLRDGELSLGLVLGDVGAATQTIDMSLEPNGTYAIFVRAAYQDTDKQNRVHWDQATDQEKVLFEDTREELVWEWTFRSTGAPAPAGGDWVKVAVLTVNVGAIIASADWRHFYFEGDATTGAGQYAHEWGDGATDRNADRILYGVQDLHKWTHLVRRQLSDIYDPAAAVPSHYVAIPIGLKALAVEHKTSGAHDDVHADSVATDLLYVSGHSTNTYAVAIDQADMNRDEPGLYVSTGEVVPSRNLVSIDHDALIAIPTLLHEAFMFPDTAAPDTDVPGKRWGTYYTAGHTGVYSLLSEVLIDPKLPCRRLGITTDVGGAGYFAGIRTGPGPNNQDTQGYWAIRHRPVCSVLFYVPTTVHIWEEVEFGFYNDVTPLDSDPSRVFILWDCNTGNAYLHIVADDGTDVAGAVDLNGGVGTLADTPYAFKIAIDDESNAYGSCLKIPVVASDSVSLGVKSMTAGCGYSFYFIGRTTDPAQATIVHLCRFTVSDQFYAGPITPLS
jgi:hypothetical protein